MVDGTNIIRAFDEPRDYSTFRVYDQPRDYSKFRAFDEPPYEEDYISRAMGAVVDGVQRSEGGVRGYHNCDYSYRIRVHDNDAVRFALAAMLMEVRNPDKPEFAALRNNITCMADCKGRGFVEIKASGFSTPQIVAARELVERIAFRVLRRYEPEEAKRLESIYLRRADEDRYVPRPELQLSKGYHR